MNNTEVTDSTEATADYIARCVAGCEDYDGDWALGWDMSFEVADDGSSATFHVVINSHPDGPRFSVTVAADERVEPAP